MSKIALSFEKVQKIIEGAAAKSNRDPSEVEIVVVTKTVPSDLIEEAINAGAKEIGENRVQEIREKYDVLGQIANWHFVGHLQKNKVKYIIDFVKLVHSVDSLRLAQEINTRAKNIDKIQDILIQVNVSGEEAKFGVQPVDLMGFLKELSELLYIKVRGLMTMAPFVIAEETRPAFRELKDLFDQIKAENITNIDMKYLSMGMTNDFEVAIEEGSNMVRLGSAIFRTN